MKRIEVYETSRGHIEKDKNRAFAWEISAYFDLHEKDTKVTFSVALALIEHKDALVKLFNEYDSAE